MVLLVLTLSGIATGEKSIQSRLQDFALEVYQNYAAELFIKVYGAMHPSIHSVLSEEEYLAFQEHHFERLSLKISEIEVGEVSANPRIPAPLRALLPADSGLQLYGVGLSYRAHFISGIRLNQGISKTVYIAVANPGAQEESMYLLWDPNSIWEEEQNNDNN